MLPPGTGAVRRWKHGRRGWGGINDDSRPEPICAIQRAMKTLSVADARKGLSALLDRVKEGEDIGIIAGDQIIQLRPVQVVAWEESYLFQEYNVTPQDWERFKRRMKSRRAKQDYAGFTGAFDPNTLA